MKNRSTVFVIVGALWAHMATIVTALILLGVSSIGRSTGWLTIEEAADYLNVSERFVRRLIAQRRVTFHHFGRHVRIRPSDLDAFAEAGRFDARP